MLGQPDSGVLFTDPRAGGRGPGGCREPSRSAGSRNVDSWRHGPTAIGSLFPIHTAGCSRGGGLADVLANTSGHIAASTGASPMNMNVSPNATPAPTVNHATFVAALRPRRCVMLFVEAAYCRHRKRHAIGLRSRGRLPAGETTNAGHPDQHRHPLPRR